MSGLVEQDLANRAAPVAEPGAVGASASIRVEPAKTSRILDELAGHLVDRELQVDRARGDRVRRHLRIARRRVVGDLGDCQPAPLLDRLGPERSVMPEAGQDDGDRVFTAILGERGKKYVDRVALAPARRMPRKTQPPAPQQRHRVGGQDIDPVRFERCAVARRLDRQARRAGEDLRQGAVLAFAEMRHDNERHAGIGRHRLEKPLQRLDTAGRRADAHNQKPIPANRRSRARLRTRFARKLLQASPEHASISRFA